MMMIEKIAISKRTIAGGLLGGAVGALSIYATLKSKEHKRKIHRKIFKGHKIQKTAAVSVNFGNFRSTNPGTNAQFRAGGVTKGPVNALIGEAGPEVVIPMKKKFMNKKVKDVVRHYKSRESLMRKIGAKNKEPKNKAIGKKWVQHGGFSEAKDGSLVPTYELGNRRPEWGAAGYGSSMGSLAAGGPPISGSVRAGSTVNLR